MKYTFSELRARISIIEIAEKMGYRINRSAGLRKPEMQLIEGGKKVDEIIIYNPDNKGTQTFFSRSIGDKGNLIIFVKNRLNYFAAQGKTEYEAANEILHEYLNQPIEHKTYIEQDFSKVSTTKFSLDDYVVEKGIVSNCQYLQFGRSLSPKTIYDFCKNGSIYSVSYNGTKIKNIGFPYRIPGQEEIVNFELRNRGKETGQSFKRFCKGGNKSTACWIAAFVPNNEVRQLYVAESAIDMMSLYELKHFSKNTPVAFVSTGGNPVKSQIEKLKEIFPNAILNLCHDNDINGQIFNVNVAMFYRGINCKGNYNQLEGTINFNIGDKTYTFKDDSFHAEKFLHEMKITDNIILPNNKDFNEDLKQLKFEAMIEK